MHKHKRPAQNAATEATLPPAAFAHSNVAAVACLALQLAAATSTDGVMGMVASLACLQWLKLGRQGPAGLLTQAVQQPVRIATDFTHIQIKASDGRRHHVCCSRARGRSMMQRGAAGRAAALYKFTLTLRVG